MELKSKQQIVDRQLHIYNMYSDRLKDIIAFLEIEFRGHPLPVLDDVRGLHDLMAACFDPDIRMYEGEKAINELLDCAEDTYAYAVAKCYNGAVYKYGKRVAWRYRWTELFCSIKSVTDGDFYGKYQDMKKHAADKLKEADGFFDTEFFADAYEPYKEVLDCLVSMDRLYDDHLQRINRAVWKGVLKRFGIAFVAILILVTILIKFFG